MVLVVAASFVYLSATGFSYYRLGAEERFYNESHQLLKPSGFVGHGLGIIGSLLISVGVGIYMIRKRVRRFYHLGVLKYWLEFHIFLCSLGAVLVLFHTAFKFGGIVAVSFWCMVAVVLSGIIGRYIYIQIPRSIEGREFSLAELQQKKLEFAALLSDKFQLSAQVSSEILHAVNARPDRSGGNSMSRFFRKLVFEQTLIHRIQQQLKTQQLTKRSRSELVRLVHHEIRLNRKLDRLITMQNLFRYWHVAHLPFALIMLLIMLVHIGVALAFGYKWIF